MSSGIGASTPRASFMYARIMAKTSISLANVAFSW